MHPTMRMYILTIFIGEVKSWPATRDLDDRDDYGNKNAKRNAWEAVIRQIVPDFNDITEVEKKVIGK